MHECKTYIDKLKYIPTEMNECNSNCGIGVILFVYHISTCARSRARKTSLPDLIFTFNPAQQVITGNCYCAYDDTLSIQRVNTLFKASQGQFNCIVKCHKKTQRAIQKNKTVHEAIQFKEKTPFF